MTPNPDPTPPIGERVYLRPLEREDLAHIRRWSNDLEIRRLTGTAAPMTETEADAFWQANGTDPSRIWFMIVLKDNDRVIGETGLLRIFSAWRTTDLTIILGEKDVWGRGYGTEVALLMLDYAFGHLGLHRVAVGVVGFNERALRFWEKVGFRREGVERDGYYCDHRFSDFVMMSILEHEYRNRHRLRS